MKDDTSVPVRDAATVILLRDAPDLEVLMLRRNDESVFASGAYVFPGGRLDEADRRVAERASGHPALQGRDDENASLRLGVDSGGLAYWLAALRECFEEAGLLVARRSDGGPVAPEDVAGMADLRPAVEQGSLSFVEMVDDAGLHLDLSELHYFAHWITPVGPPRRYDTRFFVAAAPDGQEPSPDGSETLEAMWFRPADALERFADGDLELIFPTLRSLEALDRFDRTSAVLEAAAGYDDDPSPQAIVRDHSGARIRLPGDPDLLPVGGDRV